MQSDIPEVRIMYLGVNPYAAQWIARSPFRVVATAHLHFLYGFTLNPADLLFQATYHLIRKQRLAVARRLHRYWSRVRSFTSGRYRRYAGLLDYLVTSGAGVISANATESLLHAIHAHRIDMLLVHGWDILPQEVFAALPYGAVNVHPSQLPRYKGALPTLWALRNHDPFSCVTIQRIGTGIDGGEIITQHPFSIFSEDTSLDVQKTVDKIVERHIYDDVLGYVSGAITPQAQSGSESWTGRYQKYRRIDWKNEAAREIINKVLLYPHIVPSTYCHTRLQERVIAIKGAALHELPHGLTPASYLVHGATLIVGCNDSAIASRLFLDVGFRASMKLMLVRSGSFC